MATKQITDKAFQDEKCTCYCGNIHEYYGGKGYTTILREACPTRYTKIIKCNTCNKKHTFQY